MPEWTFRVWSDMGIGTPFKRNLPKWWGKYEIYESDLKGPAIITDLDVVFVKPLVILPEHEHLDLMIRDPWRDGIRSPERLCGGFMYVQEATRKELFAAWNETMTGDDQPLLTAVLGDRLRFQDEYLDHVVSYKVQVKALGLQPDNCVVYFHGQPRPWDVKADWIPSL